MNNYEQKIRRVIGLTMALAGTSFMVTLILFAIYFAKLHYSKLFFVAWSAVATILAVIAQDRFNRFQGTTRSKHILYARVQYNSNKIQKASGLG
ncbi:hypothetical protein ABFU27_00160 [Xanthomonas campestris pv. raphani]|uniref:hypothetical protein n=1 Tax=Xanthomonas campestris TaxID=339 RepID=UPI00388EF099